MATKLAIEERLDRIEAAITELKDLLLFEKHGQAEEIDKIIERWKDSQYEPREVPIAD